MEISLDLSHASYAVIRSESISPNATSFPSMNRMKLLSVDV